MSPAYVLISSGTAGDVLPFVRIGGALAARGHRVIVFANCVYGPLVSESGAEFEPLDTEAEYRALVEDGPLLQSAFGVPVYIRRHLLSRLPLIRARLVALGVTGESVLVARAAAGLTGILADEFGMEVASVHMSPGLLATMGAADHMYRTVLAGGHRRLAAVVRPAASPRLEFVLEPWDSRCPMAWIV